jgi:small subunit ribosomal protein S5e
VPHTAGRYQTKRFRKAQCPIVERLTNSLMMHGRNNGKKQLAVRIVRHALEIVHLLSDQNPVQVVVDAIINAGPREDATRIGSAGVVRRQAVDISPLRRVNQAIFLITTGAREAAFRNVKTIAECLADELINAAKGSSNSYAIKKKDEIERVAKGATLARAARLFLRVHALQAAATRFVSWVPASDAYPPASRAQPTVKRRWAYAGGAALGAGGAARGARAVARRASPAPEVAHTAARGNARGCERLRCTRPLRCACCALAACVALAHASLSA